MTITKNIIIDLLPAYLSGDASDDTKRLVEEYLRTDPSIAQTLREASEPPVPRDAHPPIPTDVQLASLMRTRSLIRIRSWVMAFAIFFTLVPFSFLHKAGTTYWLFLESPTSAGVYFFLGLSCWIAYAVLRHRSRDL